VASEQSEQRQPSRLNKDVSRPNSPSGASTSHEPSQSRSIPPPQGPTGQSIRPASSVASESQWQPSRLNKDVSGLYFPLHKSRTLS
jgi:hypothetical protein